MLQCLHQAHPQHPGHLNLLHDVLSRLQAHGYQINPNKCSWAVKEAEFLGHWLTPTGVKPLKKKIGGIMALDNK